VAVRVDRRRVPGEVDRLAGDLLPVVLRVPLRLRPEASGETGERALDHEDPLLAGLHLVAVAVDDRGLDARERNAAGAGLDRQERHAVRVADDRPAGLGLPVVIDDGDAIAERLFLEPLPGRRVQHLTGAEDALER